MQERYADVRAHRFKPRGVENAIRRSFYESVFSANCLNQSTGARLLFDDAHVAACLRQQVSGDQARKTCADDCDGFTCQGVG